MTTATRPCPYCDCRELRVKRCTCEWSHHFGGYDIICPACNMAVDGADTLTDARAKAGIPGPTERLFCFLGDILMLHHKAETDLAAAAMVYRARCSRMRYDWTCGDWVDEARQQMLRLADEAVGLDVEEG